MALVGGKTSFLTPILFYLLTCGGAYLVHARVLEDVHLSKTHSFQILPTNVVDASYKNAFECSNGDGFYPVDECDPYYYVCLSGEVYPQVCPGNGIFDPATSSCVEYGSSSCATTTAFTGSTPISPINCGEDGFYAFGNCLESYYLCVDGVAYFEQCPSGLVFVESLQTCKTPAEAGCPEITSTSPSITTPISTSTAFMTTTTMATKTTTASTTTTESTNPPSTTTTSITSPKTTTTTTTPQPTCDEPDGFYAYGPCRNEYYKCINGVQSNQYCPNSWVFDEWIATCVPEGECNDCTPEPTTVAPGTFQCPNSNTTFHPIEPGACSEYYVTCYQCQAYPQKCPPGTLFDESEDACDLVENDPCNQTLLQQKASLDDVLRYYTRIKHAGKFSYNQHQQLSFN